MWWHARSRWKSSGNNTPQTAEMNGTWIWAALSARALVAAIIQIYGDLIGGSLHIPARAARQHQKKSSRSKAGRRTTQYNCKYPNRRRGRESPAQQKQHVCRAAPQPKGGVEGRIFLRAVSACTADEISQRRGEALRVNISAGEGLQDVLKSNLGPLGTIKM